MDSSHTPTQIVEDTSNSSGLKSFKELLKESLGFFKEHKKSVFVFFFLLTFIPSFIQTILQFFAGKLLPTFHSPIATIIVVFLLSIIGLVVSFLVQIINLGAVKKIADVDAGNSEDFIKSLRSILKKTVPITWTALLVFILLFGGTFMLIVPGILFAISATFVFAIVTIEEKKGMDAIVTSFWYVNGKRKAVFARTLLFILLLTLIAAIIFTILASITIGISILVFGGFEAAITWYVNFILTNAGNEYVPATNLFYVFVLVWSLFASAISAFFLGLFNIFSFKLWQNIKQITHTHIPDDFKNAKKKQIKIFAWVGATSVVLLIATQIILVYYQCQKIHCPL